MCDKTFKSLLDLSIVCVCGWLCDRFVLSLADVDPKLLMEGENLMWVSHDAVFVLQHPGDPIPLR